MIFLVFDVVKHLIGNKDMIGIFLSILLYNVYGTYVCTIARYYNQFTDKLGITHFDYLVLITIVGFAIVLAHYYLCSLVGLSLAEGIIQYTDSVKHLLYYTHCIDLDFGDSIRLVLVFVYIFDNSKQ